MNFITLVQAKEHLRVNGVADDPDITLKLEAAEQSAVAYLNRHVYVDQLSLTAAVDAVPAALTAATTDYDAAITAACAIENEVERDMAIFAANENYEAAKRDARRTHQGMVINSHIKAAVLLMLGHLYANREDVVAGITVTELPNGAQALLRQYRTGMGV
jgi:hypothetical protein